MQDEFEQSRFSTKVVCETCYAENLVKIVYGPKHGGWEDDDTYECAGCGAVLGREKAFSIDVSLIAA